MLGGTSFRKTAIDDLYTIDIMSKPDYGFHMTNDIQPFIAIADAIATLFKPHAEVVLHNLRDDRILHIAGNFSRRKAGDDSLSDIGEFDATVDVIGPYPKKNFDGRSLKSISAILRDIEGQPSAMLCINFDISPWEGAGKMLGALISMPMEQLAPTVMLFRADWREAINEAIANYLAMQNTTLAGLTIPDTETLVALLDQKGFLSIRHAADHIASALSISRATLYKRIAAARAIQQQQSERSL